MVYTKKSKILFKLAYVGQLTNARNNSEYPFFLWSVGHIIWTGKSIVLHAQARQAPILCDALNPSWKNMEGTLISLSGGYCVIPDSRPFVLNLQMMEQVAITVFGSMRSCPNGKLLVLDYHP